MLSMASVVPFYGVKVVLSEVDVSGEEIVTAEEASMDLEEEGALGSLQAESPVLIAGRPHDEATISGMAQEDVSKVHGRAVGRLL